MSVEASFRFTKKSTNGDWSKSMTEIESSMRRCKLVFWRVNMAKRVQDQRVHRLAFRLTLTFLFSVLAPAAWSATYLPSLKAL